MFDPRTALENARQELLLRTVQLRDERDTLPNRESELQEQARLLREAELNERLDARTKAELDEIELALTKVLAGTWGLCEACHQPIARPRLEAMPAARLCLPCAEEYERRGDGLPAAASVAVAPGAPPPRELTDAQLTAAIQDRLAQDERLDLEELKVEVIGGRVFLSGSLPDERQRTLILKILSDNLDVRDPDDRVAIDPALWQTRQRSPDPGEPRKMPMEARVTHDTEQLATNPRQAEREEVPHSPASRPLPDES